jgi:hypothetical protein
MNLKVESAILVLALILGLSQVATFKKRFLFVTDALGIPRLLVEKPFGRQTFGRQSKEACQSTVVST